MTHSVLDVLRLRARLGELLDGAVDHDRVRIVRAPGRVNLIGEHTDYNDGFVLPAAIGLETRIASLPSEDRWVEIMLDSSGERAGFDLDRIGPPRGDWIDYAAGMAWSLARRGIPMRGFRGVLASTIPISAGLSSSAALELAAAWAVCEAATPPLEPLELARAAQLAENEYVGVACGLLDQFASALGLRDAAMLLDCRSLEWRKVALPTADYVLVAIDSGSPRRLAASEYNARRAECEAAVRTLATFDPEVRSLRDATPALLEAADAALSPVERRRAQHVVGENARVLEAVAALETGDLATVGRCMAQSHDSLSRNYEVSSPALDALVDIARGVDGVVGARMTGAGFGGCTVNLMVRAAVEPLTEAVSRGYTSRTGLTPRVYPLEVVNGAGLVDA